MRMMNTILALAVLTATASVSGAAPYFRLLDLNKPQLSAGAFVDPSDPAETLAGTTLAIVTHSPKDGCLLPKLACVDWTPLGIGYAAGGGHHRLAMGPSANLAPMVKGALYNALMRFSDEDRYLGLKSTLSPSRSPKDLSAAFGPSWMVSPTAKPTMRIFAGAAWYFD